MAEGRWCSFHQFHVLLPGVIAWFNHRLLLWQLKSFVAHLQQIAIVDKGKYLGMPYRNSDSRQLPWSVVQWYFEVVSTLLQSNSSMAPRYRATPRRGRHQGQRSGAGRKGNRSPRRISPLNCASPSSIRTGDSGQSINHSVQTARFSYRRRTARPVIMTLITIIFEEEDETEGSLAADSSAEGTEAEHSPGNSNVSSPNWGKEDSSYSPSSPSKLVEESSPAPTEEQIEARAEMGSMLDLNEPVIMPDKQTMTQDRAEATTSAPQLQTEPKLPDFYYENTLYPKLPPGMKLEDVSVGMEIAWEPLDELKEYKPEKDK